MDKPARRKTPQQKKEDFYGKDRISIPEYPHQFRKAKPRKKKGVNRQERSRARNLIRNAILQSKEENLTAPLLQNVATPIRNFPWKGAASMRDIVQWKLARRAEKVRRALLRRKKSARFTN